MRGEAVDYSNVAWANNRGAETDIKENRPEQAKAKLAVSKQSSEKATQMNPNLAAGFVNLGTALNGLGEHESAKTVLERAVQLRDDWYFAHNELGTALKGLGQFAAAIAVFQRVVGMNDKFAKGLYNLGEAQFAIGDKKAAEATFKKLKKLDPALASRLDGILKGRIQNEINKRNPINKLPVKPKLPF
jgi:tetratricopeptide (TPR) repeat protein